MTRTVCEVFEGGVGIDVGNRRLIEVTPPPAIVHILNFRGFGQAIFVDERQTNVRQTQEYSKLIRVA